MLTIRTVILLVLAGQLAIASAERAPAVNPGDGGDSNARTSVPGSPAPKKLPDVVDADSRALLQSGEFERARQSCESRIQSSALVTEPGALAGPYLCLAEALFGLKNYEAAALAFAGSVTQLESSVGVFDPRLVLPLEGLGKTLMRLGRLDAAEDALTQAKDLTHRNFGIYNLVQSSIVNRLTTTFYKRGDLADASREQNFLLRAHEETHGETPQLLPAIRRMAKWQERTGRYDLARDSYRRALRIMERAYGSDDLRLAGPLRDFASSYTATPRGANRVMSRSGANALREVIALYERQEFTDAVDLAQSWGELGDWHVIGGRRGAARKAYSQAGRILQAAAGTDAGEESDVFSRPVEIEFEEVPIVMRPSRVESLPAGLALLEFEFTVNAEGRVADVVVVRDDLNYPRFAFEVGQRIKASRYRPRIVDGQPVTTRGVRKTVRYDMTRRQLPRVPDTAKGAETAQDPVDGNASATAPTETEEAGQDPDGPDSASGSDTNEPSERDAGSEGDTDSSAPDSGS